MTPNTIVQYWNTPELPNDIAELVETWKNYNPSMEHKLFGYEEACAFIGQHYNSEVESLFKLAALPAMQSDIFRVAYCLKMGGFYVDCGIRCKAPIQPLLSSDLLLLVRKWHGGIMNGAIGCRAGHPALEWIWNRILKNLKERNSNDVWRLTGPLSFNQMVESGEFENSLNIVEQAATKPFFDIVNELEHKKKHWSKEQEKQSVFSDEAVSEETNALQKPAPVQKTDTSLPSSEVKPFNARDSVDTSNCQVTISGGFVKENVSRLVMNVSGIVLTSGESKPFPIIVNKRGERAEVEFYAPLPHRYFPLRQFVTSDNNGVTDYMLVMPENTENSAFYKLSTTDQSDLITILMQLHIALSKQQALFENNVIESTIGGLEMWCQTIETLIARLSDVKTKEVSNSDTSSASIKIAVKKLALITKTDANNAPNNKLALSGEANIEGAAKPTFFNVLLSADSKVNNVLSVNVDNPALKLRTVELTQAIAEKIHKTDCKGKTPQYSLERWYFAMKSFVNENG